MSEGQKKTKNLKWPSAEVGLEDDQVRLRIWDEEKDKYVTKRRVDNKIEADTDGLAAATVTFPEGYVGKGKYEIQGPDGIYHGEFEVE
jgi:predicted nucleotidyltransferase